MKINYRNSRIDVKYIKLNLKNDLNNTNLLIFNQNPSKYSCFNAVAAFILFFGFI